MQHGRGPYDRPRMQRGQEIHERPADAPEPDPEDGTTSGEGNAQDVIIHEEPNPAGAATLPSDIHGNQTGPTGMLAAADVDDLVNAIWESSREMQVAMGELLACHVRLAGVQNPAIIKKIAEAVRARFRD